MSTTIKPVRGYHERPTNELLHITAILKQKDIRLPVDLLTELQFRGVNANDI